MRVLLVNGIAEQNRLLAAELTRLGHDVRSAGKAAEALPLALEFQPEVICTEPDLPDASADELATTLRAHPGLRHSTIVRRSDSPWEKHHSDRHIDLHLTKESLLSAFRSM